MVGFEPHAISPSSFLLKFLCSFDIFREFVLSTELLGLHCEFNKKMTSNITTSGNDGTNSDDGVTLRLTIVALSTSFVAIILSILQAVLAYLQFDNSEIGRRRCSEEVMGRLWAEKTRRKFKWREWRYQVFFEVPVFYTAPPGYVPASVHLYICAIYLNQT